MLKISVFILYSKQAHSRTYTDVAAGNSTFYRFGQICGEMYLPLEYHAEQF